MVATDKLYSIREARNELEAYNEVEHLETWIKENTKIFRTPTPDELEFVAEIFKIKHFRALIGRKALLKGTPVADPFLIAAAAMSGDVVVTQERLKPNGAKVPNVCLHFNIECVDLERFMEIEDWSF